MNNSPPIEAADSRYAGADARKSSRRQRWQHAWARFHRWLGLIGGAFLAIVGLTGSLFVFHNEFGEALAPETRRVQIASGGQGRYQSWSNIINWASKPNDSRAAFVVSFIDVPGSTLSAWSERTVFLDQYSGDVLRIDDPSSRRSAGETFLAWQWPLHNGHAFGWTGRLIVFAAGFVPLILYVTGIKVWLRKRRASNRPAPQASFPPPRV